MKALFAPWRIEYIKMEKPDGCVFCTLSEENNDEKNLILTRGRYAFVIMNNYPYNPGHVMVVPYRHVGNWESLKDEEVVEINMLVRVMIKAIKNTMNPEGFNMGVNIGRVAGAGIVDHVHVHVVPRWNGDTNFMPVLSDTKVIPQAIRETYNVLKEEIEKRFNESNEAL